MGMSLYIFLGLFIYLFIFKSIYLSINLFTNLFLYVCLTFCSCLNQNIKKRPVWALESLTTVRMPRHLIFEKITILRLKWLCLFLSSASFGYFENCINFQIFLTVPAPLSFPGLASVQNGRHANRRLICRSDAQSLKYNMKNITMGFS